MKRLNCSRDVYVKWAGSRETISTPVEARVFFLTSLFIELFVKTCGCEVNRKSSKFECYGLITAAIVYIVSTVPSRPVPLRLLASKPILPAALISA